MWRGSRFSIRLGLRKKRTVPSRTNISTGERSEGLDVGIDDQYHVVLRRLYCVGKHHVRRVPSLLAH
jgi:hypothetical protein